MATAAEVDNMMEQTANFARTFEASTILHPLADLLMRPHSFSPYRVMPVETRLGNCAIGVFTKPGAEGAKAVEVCSLVKDEVMNGFSVEIHRGVVADGKLVGADGFACEQQDCADYEFGRWGVQRREIVTAGFRQDESDDNFGHPVEQYLHGLRHSPEANDFAIDVRDPRVIDDARVVMGGVHVVGGLVRATMEEIGVMEPLHDR